jgi:hypothetical protein
MSYRKIIYKDYTNYEPYVLKIARKELHIRNEDLLDQTILIIFSKKTFSQQLI